MTCWRPSAIFVIVVSLLVFIHNFFRSIKRASRPEMTPGTRRLWSGASPHRLRRTTLPKSPSCAARMRTGSPSVKRRPGGEPITQGEPHVDASTIHMPSPSYWPLVASFGVAWLAGGS